MGTIGYLTVFRSSDEAYRSSIRKVSAYRPAVIAVYPAVPPLTLTTP